MLDIKEIVAYFTDKNYPILKGNSVNDSRLISGPRAIDEAKESHFSFISKKLASEFNEIITKTECKIILVENGLINLEEKIIIPEQVILIITNSPKRDLIDFFKKHLPQNSTINKTYIHPNASVDNNSKIGNRCYIEPNVTIEKNVTIGANCVIGAGSVIKNNSVIGDNVIIGSCNVIGGDGFGYVKNELDGSYDQFPHFGGVIIENNVHIGNNTCIDRGSLKDTLIRTGVKIDNLVHIAHNVDIGENSLIIACSMIAGSVTIGKNSWVSPSSTIRNAITIGENALVGLGSTVTKSVEKDQTVLGNPAIPKEDFLQLRNIQNRLMKNNS